MRVVQMHDQRGLIDLVGPNHIRHFHVGKGPAVLRATDTSGNVANAPGK